MPFIRRSSVIADKELQPLGSTKSFKHEFRVPRHEGVMEIEA